VSSKPIQEQFGQRVIEAFAEFARSDLKTVAEYESDEFSHIRDASLRRDLAQVFYGSRWIYKVGLALLVEKEERAAHVRAQIVDYASVCEGLLSYSVAHAIRKNHTIGTGWRYLDPDHQKKPISWNTAQPERAKAIQNFWWQIRISREFKIIDSRVEPDLQWLREQRNTVHLRARASIGKTAFINQSKKAFMVVTTTIRQTKSWRGSHP